MATTSGSGGGGERHAPATAGSPAPARGRTSLSAPAGDVDRRRAEAEGSAGLSVHRAALVCALALTLASALLHFLYLRHAGPLWRDEVNSVNVATLPLLGDVVANVYRDSFRPRG